MVGQSEQVPYGNPEGEDLVQWWSEHVTNLICRDILLSDWRPALPNTMPANGLQARSAGSSTCQFWKNDEHAPHQKPAAQTKAYDGIDVGELGPTQFEVLLPKRKERLKIQILSNLD